VKYYAGHAMRRHERLVDTIPRWLHPFIESLGSVEVKTSLLGDLLVFLGPLAFARNIASKNGAVWDSDANLLVSSHA